LSVTGSDTHRLRQPYQMVKSRIEFRAGDGRFHFLSLEMKNFTHEQELEETIEEEQNGLYLASRAREFRNCLPSLLSWPDVRFR